MHLLRYGEYLLPIIFSVVLGLIAYVNYELQIMQAESMAVARKCLEYWKSGIDGNELKPHTYLEIKEQVNFKKRFDTSTLCFIVFSFMLLFLNVFVSFNPTTQPRTTMR
jgi:hypothetical protein